MKYIHNGYFWLFLEGSDKQRESAQEDITNQFCVQIGGLKMSQICIPVQLLNKGTFFSMVV